jgi:hypothetical protein
MLRDMTSGQKQDKQVCPHAEDARGSFMCVLRYPSSSPGGSEVQGVTILQRAETTEVRLDDGSTLTFDSVELRAAVAPLDAERRAAA